MQELLCHLVEKSSTGQLNLLLLMIREGLDAGNLRAGNYRVRPGSIRPISFFSGLLLCFLLFSRAFKFAVTLNI